MIMKLCYKPELCDCVVGLIYELGLQDEVVRVSSKESLPCRLTLQGRTSNAPLTYLERASDKRFTRIRIHTKHTNMHTKYLWRCVLKRTYTHITHMYTLDTCIHTTRDMLYPNNYRHTNTFIYIQTRKT